MFGTVLRFLGVHLLVGSGNVGSGDGLDVNVHVVDGLIGSSPGKGGGTHVNDITTFSWVNVQTLTTVLERHSTHLAARLFSRYAR